MHRIWQGFRRGVAGLSAVALISGCASERIVRGGPSIAATGTDCIAGRYHGAASEIAVRLELGDDGRFQYLLIYGALDERAEGQWQARDGAVLLTSDPVEAPQFELVADEAIEGNVWRFDLDLPAGLSRQFFDVELSLADGTRQVHQFGEEGLALEGIPAGSVTGVRMLLPLFDLASPLHEPSGPGPRRIAYRFTPNDLGKVVIDAKALAAEEDSLMFDRHDRTVRLFREDRPCRRRRR